MDDAVFRMFQDLLEFQEETLARLAEIEEKLVRIEKYLPEANNFPIKDYPEVKAPTPEMRDQLILDTYPYCLLADKPHEKNI